MPEIEFGQMCIANDFSYSPKVPFIRHTEQLKKALIGQRCVVLRNFGDGSCSVKFEHDSTWMWPTDALTPIDNNQNLQP